MNTFVVNSALSITSITKAMIVLYHILCAYAMYNPIFIGKNTIKKIGDDFISKKISRSTFIMTSPPTLAAYSSIVGKKEGDGPLGDCFDVVCDDAYFGQATWEKAESELQLQAVELTLKKRGITAEKVDFMFAGDLLNQCIGTTFGMRKLSIPLLGIYGACSTMAEGLLLSALMTDNNLGGNIIAVTSSHFCTAERQFRLPLSYGGQRAPTAQWTCTASGAILVSPTGAPPYLRGVTIGKIVDLGIIDASNMGGAMAPAAADTIKTYLDATKKQPSDFDFIVTGDLGAVGSTLLIELLQKESIDICAQHKDCGNLIFDALSQDVHAGGSGCGCSAAVLCGHFLPKVATGEIQNMLFVATGALMSPTATAQGESIPSIAHLVHISATK